MTTAAPATDLTIPVQGMTCAACSARVQRALERTPGVSSANVNLMTSMASVSYDPSTVTAGRLVDAIRDTGYGAELPVPDAPVEAMVDAQDAARDAEMRDLRRKLAVSLLAAAVTTVIHAAIGRIGGEAGRWLLLAVTV